VLNEIFDVDHVGSMDDLGIAYLESEDEAL
jgi:hypothetical protein